MRDGRFWNIRLWIGLGLIGYGLLSLDRSQPRTAFWALEPLMYAALSAGVWLAARDRRPRLVASRRSAAALYVVLSWAACMMFEMTLTEGAGGIGGMHADTRTSFTMAQGFYVPFAVFSLLLIRRYRLSMRDIYVVGGAASLYEAVPNGLSWTVFSPQAVLLPFVLGYYVLVYGLFLALPLAVIDERLLWAEAAAPSGSRWRVWKSGLAGLAIGAVSWLIFTAIGTPLNVPKP